jgi:ketosteroid isomerase-like protein
MPRVASAILATHPMSANALPIAAAFEAISRLDADALVALCHPDVRFESRITAVEDATYEGHEGIRRYVANLSEAFADVHVESFDVVADVDRAVATNRFSARGRGSGVEVEQRFVAAAKGYDGRLMWWGFFESRSEALDAVGLPEQAPS